jgi:hypothetical protein
MERNAQQVGQPVPVNIAGSHRLGVSEPDAGRPPRPTKQLTVSGVGIDQPEAIPAHMFPDFDASRVPRLLKDAAGAVDHFRQAVVVTVATDNSALNGTVWSGWNARDLSHVQRRRHGQAEAQDSYNSIHHNNQVGRRTAPPHLSWLSH